MCVKLLGRLTTTTDDGLHIHGQMPWQRFAGLVRAQVSWQFSNVYEPCPDTISLRALFAKLLVKLLDKMVEFNRGEEDVM